MSETQYPHIDGDKVIKIVEQLKTEILRELPAQKDYVKVQEKIQDNLDGLEINLHESQLVLKSLKLELTKFSKTLERSKDHQTEQFNDLLTTIDGAFSEFQKNISSFTKNYPKELKEVKREQTAELTRELQNNLKTIEKLLTPLHILLSKEQFLEHFNKYIQYINDGISKIENKFELSTVEILANQKTLSRPEDIHKATYQLQDQIKTHFQEIKTQIENNPLPKKLEQVSMTFDNSLKRTEENLSQQIDNIPISKYLKQIEESFQKEIQQHFAVLIQRYDNDPTSKQISDVYSKLNTDLKSLAKQLQEDLQKLNNSTLLRNIESKLLNLDKETPKLAHYSNIVQNVKEISGQLKSLSSDQDVKELKKLVIQQNPLPNIDKFYKEFQKNAKEIASQQNILLIQQDLANIRQKIGDLGILKYQQDIKNSVEKILPQKMEDQTKQLLQNHKESTQIAQINKENLIKLNELVNSYKNAIFERASAQKLNELHKYLEQFLPNLQAEFRNEFRQNEKFHEITLQSHSKIESNLADIIHITHTIPEMDKILKESVQPGIQKQQEIALTFANSTRESFQQINKQMESITTKIALESSLQEIRKYSSKEGFESLLIRIQKSIIPVIEQQTNPLAKTDLISKLEREITNLAIELRNNFESSQKESKMIISKLNDQRILLDQIPVKEEFENFRIAFDNAIQKQLPQIVEENLSHSAKEESLNNIAIELRENLKQIYQVEALIQTTTKDSSLISQDTHQKLTHIKNDLEIQLKEIREQVSEEVWKRHFEQIKTTVSRFAREESITNFRQFYERQTNQLNELFEDQRQKVLINQNKINSLHEKVDHVTTVEDLSNLGEFIIEHVKTPLESTLKPIVQATAKEETLQKNHESIIELIDNIAKHDEVFALKSEQESMNKFLYKLLKIIEDNQDHNHYLEEQINALSEKLTLLFEFMKRVSGV